MKKEFHKQSLSPPFGRKIGKLASTCMIQDIEIPFILYVFKNKFMDSFFNSAMKLHD